MTDIEDQLRAYAAAMTAWQRPVEVDEAIARRRRRGPRLAVVTIAVVVVFVAGVAGAVLRGAGGSKRVDTGPPPSEHRPALGSCPAASLVVSSTSGERLQPNWLPAGFALRNGNEADLGQIGDLNYPTRRSDSRVEILRYHSTQPLTSLFLGTPTPTVVQGRPGIRSVGNPDPQYAALLWRPQPGVVLVVNGYKLPQADLYKVATNVQYAPGSPFRYPAHVRVRVTRQQALTALVAPSSEKHVALSSFGEFDTLARSDSQHLSALPVLAAGPYVTRPVWIAWTQSPAHASISSVDVIDAQTDQLISIPGVAEHALESITDRSQPSCAPPLGVLTRSETSYLQPPPQGTAEITKLSTQGIVDSYEHISPTQCDLPSTCDATVPVWIFIQTASDQRFTQAEDGIGAGPTNTKPGSFSITMLDARTGPQNTNFAGEAGPGTPPASILAVPDLTSPQVIRPNDTHVDRSGPLPSDIASLSCAAAGSGKATSIEYVATTERRETQLLNTEDGYSNTPVWVIEMRGSFTASQEPPGGTAPHGTVATATYDQSTHASIGSGIMNQYHDLHVLAPVGTLTC
jgi:hypothetical protein